MAERRALLYPLRMLAESVPPPSSRRSRPRISIVRTRTTPQDGATTLALHLAVVRATHRLDVVALVDLEGTLLASAGDRTSAEELAAFAAHVAEQPPARRAQIVPSVGVIVELVEHGDRTWIVAATAIHPTRDVRAILASIRDVLPALAAAARAREAPPRDDLDAAFDDVFGAAQDHDDDDDPLAGLADLVG